MSAYKAKIDPREMNSSEFAKDHEVITMMILLSLAAIGTILFFVYIFVNPELAIGSNKTFMCLVFIMYGLIFLYLIYSCVLFFIVCNIRRRNAIKDYEISKYELMED